MTGHLVIMLRRRQNSAKREASSKDKCFNCHKMGHFGRDYTAPDTRPLKKKANKITSQQHS